MNGKYIKQNDMTSYRSLNMTELLYRICQSACTILVIYFFWYVEAFGNWAILVNGTFLVLSTSIVLIWTLEREIRVDQIPFGIWSQLIMIIYCILTGSFTAYDSSTLLHAIRQYMIYFFIMYAICFVSAHKGSYRWLLQSIIFSTLICCIHLLFFGYHYSANRIVLTKNNNPNLLGTILNLGLFALIIFQSKKKEISILKMGFAVLILYNIVMSGSRKSFIAAAILFFGWSLIIFSSAMSSQNLKKILFALIFLVVEIVLSWYWFNHFLVHTELFSRMETMNDEVSNRSRIEMYREAINVFFQKPFFGGGLHQYRFWSGRGGYAHSTYAEAIADFGLLGCILYFFPFGYTFIVLLRAVSIKYEPNIFRMTVFFCIIELFWGAGQIWFFEICHFFGWTMIFLIIQDLVEHTNITEVSYIREGYKYVR